MGELAAPSIVNPLGAVRLDSLADITDPINFSAALQWACDEGYRKIIIPGRGQKWQMAAGVVLPAKPIWITGEGNPGRADVGGTLIEYIGPDSNPAFKTTSGIVAPHFSDFKLIRAGTEAGLAAAALIGIEMPGLVEDAHLERLWVEGFYNAVKGGATSYSYMDNVIANKSSSDGILIANSAVANGLQWTFNRCLAQLSGRDGYRWDTAAGTGPTSVGEMVNCNTYANSGYGLNVQDTATSKLTGVRLTGGFFGEDRKGGVRISSHRGLHKIVGIESEINGTAMTGPPTAQTSPNALAFGLLLAKPASYVAGLDFNECLISGSKIAFNNASGLYSEFALTCVTGNDFRGNGQSGIASACNNIQFAGFGTSVASVVTGNTIISAKGFGIFAHNDNHVWTGNLIGGVAGTPLNNALGAVSTNGTGTSNGVYSGNKIF